MSSPETTPPPENVDEAPVENPTDAQSTGTNRRTHDIQDPLRPAAVARANPARLPVALERAKTCARIAALNRGRDILLLDLREATSLIDYFVIVTATSQRQARSIVEEIDKEMKARGERKLGVEGGDESRWILIDYGDFVVHVFSRETRDYYRLEDLWGDAAPVDWESEDADASQTR